MTRRTLRTAARATIALGSFLAVLSPAPSAVAGVTILVTTVADDIADNGNCTLREAVIAANTDTQQGECMHDGSIGADTIQVPPGTYTLSLAGGENMAMSGDLDLREDVNIVAVNGGNATNVVVQAGTMGVVGATPGNGTDRVFDVIDDAGAHTSSISGITIRHGVDIGSGGGAIRNEVTLTVEDSVVAASYTSGAGGGIWNDDATLVIRRSAVVGNLSDGTGGGIYSSGSMRVHSSTVSGNSGSIGGGMRVAGGITVLMGSTVANNNTNGAVPRTADSAGAISGGGIAQDNLGQVYLQGTVVADNASNMGPDCTGTISAGGSDNIIENPSGCTFSASEFTVADPMLAALAVNAPGTTPTHALPSTSPAVGAFDSGGCSNASGLFESQPVDQRGVARPQGSACDSGAFELQPQVPGICKGKTATVTGTTDPETLAGTKGNDVIAALGGNDIVNGAGGNDLICGGDGNDKLNGGGGNDKVLGEAGNDKLKGGGGNDKMIGAAGTDKCAGGGGDKDKAKKCEKGGGVP